MTLTDLLPATPDPDALFDAFAGWSKRRGLALYPHQEEALIEIVSGANVILSAPTGSGKSLVAAGAGLTLVPELAAQNRPAGVRLLPPAEPVTRQIFTVSRRGGDRKPAVRVVLDALTEAARDLPAAA